MSEKVLVSQERVSGFPEKGDDLRGSPGTSGEVWGHFRGSLGNFRGTSGLLSSSTVRELPGKSPKTSGEVRGTSGEVRGLPEARGCLTPYQRLAKFVSNFGPELLGQIFVILFSSKRGPPKNFTFQKVISQNSPSKVQPRIVISGTP